MEPIRKPFQGVTNIIRFNWHFYFLSGLLILLLFIISISLSWQYAFYLYFLSALILATIAISLLVSFYVYDLSHLYSFSWLDELKLAAGSKCINIHAGFDETSALLNTKYPASDLLVFDFYNPEKHTEVSIRRARKAYPSFPDTQVISTTDVPLNDDCADIIFLILSAHEIRDDTERVNFFKALGRAVKPSGKLVVTEHLRDWPNFLAYNIGFFHFLSRSTWHETFKNASLKVCNEIKITPFITTFILERNGASS
jgi:SAM-dependent methyltransferase